MQELTKEEVKKYKNPELYVNRELSWLEFDKRCLSEARSRENPLLERIKFLSITASNLDEFFMVRVASLQDQVNADYRKPDFAGMTPAVQLKAILEQTHDFVGMQYSTYNRSLQPALAEAGITVLKDFRELTGSEQEYLDNYFEEELYPVLTPMAFDSSRPFPLIQNKTLNLGALLRRKPDTGRSLLNSTKKSLKAIASEAEDLEFATVQVPSVLPRLVYLPGSSEENGSRIILLEEVIRHYMPRLFLNYDIVSVSPFRIMRNADLGIDEDGAEDLLKEIEKSLKNRRHGQAIRLEVEESTGDF